MNNNEWEGAGALGDPYLVALVLAALVTMVSRSLFVKFVAMAYRNYNHVHVR